MIIEIIYFSALEMINLFKSNVINILVLTIAVVLGNSKTIMAENNLKQLKTTQINQVITGESGGSNDSQGCGFISNTPNYKMNLEQRTDYMRLTVQANGGQPTLLVLGPNAGDRFCVLGDETSGLKPEISGVWESGSYQIYIGDRLGGQHQFTLDISTDN